MSIVNMSVDTKTRQVVVAVDGVVVPAIEAHLSKFVFSDGEEILDLSFTIKSESDNGLVETRRFSLPDPATIAELVADGGKAPALDENGLVSQIEPDGKIFADHLQAFLQKKPKD